MVLLPNTWSQAHGRSGPAAGDETHAPLLPALPHRTGRRRHGAPLVRQAPETLVGRLVDHRA